MPAQQAQAEPQTSAATSVSVPIAVACYSDPDQGHDARRSVGGEIRDAYERFHSPNFSLAPANPGGYFLERILACSDTRMNSNLHLFVALDSSLEYGRAGGPRPYVDRDELDGLAGYLEASGAHGGNRINLRIGRQELALGSGRMVTLREGVNVRGPFDGLRVTVSRDQVSVDGFLLRPDITNPGIFGDIPDHQTTFWGVYGKITRSAPSIEAYYLGYDQKHAVFDQGVGHEVRHSFGAHLLKRTGTLPYDLEGVVQTGSFNGAAVRAWRAAAQITLPFAIRPRKLEFLIDADAASGDKDPKSPSLQTFRAFYQSGTYSGRAQLLGCDNAIRIEPSFAATLRNNVEITGGWAWYWRESVHDGLYGIANNLIVPDHGIVSRYEGMRPIVQIDWKANRALSVHANYIYVFNGAFEQRSVHGSKSLSYISPWIVYRF